MFTGIIETLGHIRSIEKEGSNIHLLISSSISSECKVDQSVSHNGVCLTITQLKEDMHRVTAIKETLDKSNLSLLKEDDIINLERCLKIGERLDGHMVQGHVDGVGYCISVKKEDGSWVFTFSIEPQWGGMIVNKGSVCINGVSLTVNNPTND
ncbi:MAG TPA: riboflavin synthase, partial [Saprospiraceae bacterium]|nr:riboflavin synthase [Saprospiraceae bacterium]